jgi:2-dehydropantoate 2-reductase
MKILIYGAGVIGRIYASRLYGSGCDTTVLARGSRYEDLKKNGIVLHDSLTGEQSINHIPLTQQLRPDDFYDLVIVTVRADQFAAILPVLKENTGCPLIMLMFNDTGNIKFIGEELKGKHILLGFPGVGGTSRDNFVDYIQIRQQPTTIGEITGERSPQLMEWKRIFEMAGFKITVSDNMQAWLKTHAVFIACAAAAILRENGDSKQLGRKRSSVKKMVSSIREGFAACRSLGMPIAPTNIKIIFLIMPQWFAVLYWQRAMKGKIGTLSIAPHANAAKEEMKLLAKKVMDLAHSSSIPTPALDDLLSSFIGKEAAPGIKNPGSVGAGNYQ